MSNREQRLAQLTESQPAQPSPTTGAPSTPDALQTTLAALSRSVEQLNNAQTSHAEKLDVLVATPLPPDHSEQIQTLREQVEQLNQHVRSRPAPDPSIEMAALRAEIEQLTSRLESPPHHCETSSLATLPAATKAVTSAVDTVQRTPPWEQQMSEDLRLAMVTAEQLSRALTRAAWGRLALAAVPYAVAAALLWLLVVPAAQVIGVGPLSRWAWECFESAHTGWARLGIAAAILAVVGVLCYAIYRAGRELAMHYRQWRPSGVSR